MYLLNPYNDKNLYHALNIEDILLFFKFKKGRKKYRPIKRKVKIPTLEESLRDLIKYTFSYVIEGVIRSEFIFKFGAGNITMRMVPVKNYKNYFRFYKVDPLEVDFQAYRLHLQCKLRKKTINRYVNISKEYRNIVSQRLINQETFETLKVKNISDISKDIHQKFSHLNRYDIYKIINKVFSVIRGAIIRDIDVVLRDHDRVAFIRNDDTTRIQSAKMRLKLRYLYTVLKTKYNGYYYFGMTYEQFNNRNNKENIFVSLYLIMHEAMLQQNIKPHIFRVRIPKTLEKKYIIYKNITYEKNRTKHIWRWNGKRFESVGDSKFRFN